MRAVWSTALGSSSLSAFISIPTLYQYRLDVSKNGGSWTSVLYNVYTLTHSVIGQTDGSYQYSVRACTFFQCSVRKYSSTVVIASPPASGGGTVQFIHTDLLGSPVATSDEQGNIND